MNIKFLFSILPLLFFIIACNSPSRRQVSDDDFNVLLAESKRTIQGFPDSSLMILFELLPQQQNDEQLSNRGRVLNLIGSAYDTKGMYDSAAYYLYEASRIAEVVKSDSLQMSVLSNLGILQFEMKNIDEAINYYRQSLAIAEKLKDSLAIANQLNNIGNAYLTISNELEKSIPYFEKCMEISSAINYSLGYKVAGINLAQIYNETGELDKALYEVKRINEQYGRNIYADFTLGEIYLKQGNYKESIHEFKELLKKPLNTREFEFTILKNIAEIYKTIGNLDSTVVYLEKSYALRDSLHNQQTYETINDLKIAYETDKKELAISALEGEKRIMMLLSFASVSMLLLALAAALLLWHWTVQKKRLAEQQVIQLQQEKQLIATQAVLDGEVQERTRLSRDLHDGLGSILAAAKYNLADIKKNSVQEVIDTERFDKAMNLLDESMREMRRVAHHLMPESLNKYGLKQSITDFCNSVSTVKFTYYGDDTRLDSRMEVMVYRIMHELVSNALKYSGASHIIVEIVRYPDNISLTVQDDGCGFDLSAESKGMGLANIRTRVAAYNGNLMIDSKPGVGTEINVELKI